MLSGVHIFIKYIYSLKSFGTLALTEVRYQRKPLCLKKYICKAGISDASEPKLLIDRLI